MPITQDDLVRTLISERLKILSYIRAIVRRQDLVEDVFQNVSILALQKQAEINDEQHFLKWLRLTARFEAMNAIRKMAVREQLLDHRVLDAIEHHWARRDVVPDSAVARVLDECLKRLPADKQRIVHERYGSGRSVVELAGQLGRQAGALYMTISRIHRILADCVRRRLGEQGVHYG
jgi:RNA polymerase sigma-70 factor (ECF subfamily)